MQYQNLRDLITYSSTSRKYFLSLTDEMRRELNKHSDRIHTAYDLHCFVDILEKYDRAVKISELLFLHRFI